jgi:hypothetical protein
MLFHTDTPPPAPPPCHLELNKESSTTAPAKKYLP